MPTVKYAISDYVADGTTTDYLITWDYLDEDHISVYVDGTSNADPQADHTFTKLNSTTLRITDGVGGAISAGAEIEIRRETPLLTRAITFADGSALLAEDLNKNSDYLLYSMQEVLDTVDAAAQDGALAAQVATEEFRDEAEDLRDDTLVARNTTQTYLATVQSDATDADNHRIAAAASEAAASASETAAAASEVASAASEDASASSEANSAASEAAALASEQAAAVSEVASAASEVAAAASEVAAASSEVNAEAAWGSLDDRYLGAKAVAPTLDNDGDALQTGALFWNSTVDTMYVWNGSAWDTLNSTTGIADGSLDTAITLDADGNVGIGTSSVDYTTTGRTVVHVEGEAGALLTLEDTGEKSYLFQSGDDFLLENDTTSGSMIFGTNSSTERMRINQNGNVGIGTAIPTAAIHVEQNVNSVEPLSQLKVSAGGNQFAGMTLYASEQNHVRFADQNETLKWQIRHTVSEDNLRFYSWAKAADVLVADNSGSIRKPQQPAWSLRPNWNGRNSQGLNHVMNFSAVNQRGFITNVPVSNGRVTIPTSGKYLLQATWRAESDTRDVQLSINVNSATIARSGIWYSPQPYENVHVMRLANLSANDYVEIRLTGAASDNSYGGYNDVLTFFEGYLLG